MVHLGTFLLVKTRCISEYFWFSHLFDEMPSQAVIGGELQPDLSVDVRRRFASAAHDQRELDHVGRADLHGLCFHIADTGGRVVIA